MELDIRTEGDYTVISPRGEIDFHTSPWLRQQIIDALGRGRDLLIDMTAVSFIDSSAIASLVEGLQRARDEQRRLVLAGLQEAPTQVLHLTRLDTVFPIRERVADWLEA